MRALKASTLARATVSTLPLRVPLSGAETSILLQLTYYFREGTDKGEVKGRRTHKRMVRKSTIKKSWQKRKSIIKKSI